MNQPIRITSKQMADALATVQRAVRDLHLQDPRGLLRAGPQMIATIAAAMEASVDRLTGVGLPLEDVKVEMIYDALEACNGNRERAAAMLKIGERTLYRAMAKHGICWTGVGGKRSKRA